MLYRLAAFTAFALSLAVSLFTLGCGSMRIYDVQPSVALADAKLSGAPPVIAYRPVTVDPHVVVDAQTEGPRVTKFAQVWPDAATAFDAAFLGSSDGPRFVTNDPQAPYVLTAEVVRIESGEDMDPWLQGKWTSTYVLFTLWDQPGKQMLERFTVNASEPGSWSSESAGDTAVLKVKEYLDARFAGRVLVAE